MSSSFLVCHSPRHVLRRLCSHSHSSSSSSSCYRLHMQHHIVAKQPSSTMTSRLTDPSLWNRHIVAPFFPSSSSSSCSSSSNSNSIIRTFFSSSSVSSSQSSDSSNITYSGGHASTGQGGYYGSGGARAKAEQDSTRDITQEQRSKVLAISTDVQVVQKFLEELDQLEELLRMEEDDSGGKVTDRSEELRSKRKHLVSNPKVLECLDRLQIEGAPVWGLSSEEHEMVVMAREKVNTC